MFFQIIYSIALYVHLGSRKEGMGSSIRSGQLVEWWIQSKSWMPQLIQFIHGASLIH
jgi:hypothetical protein